MDFQVLTPVSIQILYFCVVTLCSLSGRYEHRTGHTISIFNPEYGVCSSETQTSTNKTMQHQNVEDRHMKV
jgi:hypothetical protein